MLHPLIPIFVHEFRFCCRSLFQINKKIHKIRIENYTHKENISQKDEKECMPKKNVNYI